MANESKGWPDRLAEVVRAVVAESCETYEYAALTIHVGRGIPDVVIPITPANPSPSFRPSPERGPS